MSSLQIAYAQFATNNRGIKITNPKNGRISFYTFAQIYHLCSAFVPPPKRPAFMRKARDAYMSNDSATLTPMILGIRDPATHSQLKDEPAISLQNRGIAVINVKNGCVSFCTFTQVQTLCSLYVPPPRQPAFLRAAWDVYRKNDGATLGAMILALADRDATKQHSLLF